MSKSHRSLSFRVPRARACAIGAILLPVVVVSCKAPQGGSNADLGQGALPAERTAHHDEGAERPLIGEQEPNALAVNQINDFLLEARNELLAERAERPKAEIPSDNAVSSGLVIAAERLSTEDSGPTAEASSESSPDTATELTTELTIVSAEIEPQKRPEPAESSVDAAADADPISPLIKSLLSTAATSDAPLRHHLTVAIVLAMSAPERSFQPEGLSELTEEEQELVRIMYEQFRVLGQDLQMGGDSNAVIEVLSGLIDQVKAEEPFKIARMNLCSWVRDFGDVDVIDPPTFAPTERPRFIWYIELAGVNPSEDEATGSWLYEFDLRLEMLTRDTGIPVIAPIEGTVRHSASSRIHDLFLRDLVEIPPDLQFDWYTTKLTITDRRSGAQAQKSHELLWVPNLAAGASHIERRAAIAPSN